MRAARNLFAAFFAVLTAALVCALPAPTRADPLTELWASRSVDLDLSGVDAGAYQLTSGQLTPPALTMAGQLVVELTFTATADMATLFPDGGSDVYVLTADTASSGDVAIKFVASNSAIEWVVGGVTRVATPAYPALTNEYPGWSSGDRVQVLAWYDPMRGVAGMRWAVQGVWYQPLVSVVSSPPAVPTPTAVYLGSNRGTGTFPAQFTRFVSYRDLPINPEAWPVRGVYAGDSNTAALGPYTGAYRTGWPHYITTAFSHVYGLPHFVNIAVPGGTIVSQTATFDASSYKGRGEINFYALMIGVNDTSGGASLATMSSNMTLLYGDVAGSCHNVKILGVQYFPESQALNDAPKIAALEGLNAILGDAGANYVVSGHVVAMDADASAPSYTLASSLCLDGPVCRHTNNAGEQIIADYVELTLADAGLPH